ncbi:MAG: hypothetical protein ABMA15_08065 [Vicinamibacterales bacterium]
MNRLLVFALVASISQASVAFAGESMLASGTRHVQELAANQAPSSASDVVSVATGSSSIAKPAVAAYQAPAGNLSKSGMSKGKKAMIYIGLAVGFAASAWVIDHHVLDVTPSSLGTRQD